MPDKRNDVALYGNVAILREFCSACNRMALVVEGRLLCCDREASQEETKDIKRMIESEQKRRRLLVREKRIVLKEQADRCLYCSGRFGSVVRHNGKPSVLRVCWDHLVPYSYNQDNGHHNFVASCQLCNSIKGSLMFQSVHDARVHIVAVRDARTAVPRTGRRPWR